LKGSLAVLIIGHCHMPFAISLYLRLDRYKLLLQHWRPSIIPSTVVSLNSRQSLHGRDSLNYCVRGRHIIGTRHAPCPKYGAQMTTMMNTPRGIHDGLQNRLAHAADHLCWDRLAEGHQQGLVTNRVIVWDSWINPPLLFLEFSNQTKF